MAQWQAQAQAQTDRNQTLVAGQTIAVNKYTVQVERYLSQGGFAHVYLVRTATPVYNTTHHVLKRIAVPDETMLTEVKKEVDIMRILKGHPNIVHLIDAASHRMPSGTFEVFILMEFCPGGGIIDMMNRRLRERLTEAEILTIFVDVCEGLAAMHALKPPLLHRDLKVENILQSSATSYKLCDFGSATPVQRIPSTGVELRALQADLDRHTTMQYRAPEMVNLLQRRPIDEKSDVWALGVLLYKLCYYTTPFEERGPLAIQNVNYTIPPYPVYSQHMISLISSMLREYGTQRPSVFEILTHVHTLRGTKSRYTYTTPVKQPSVPARAVVGPPLQPLSSNISALGSTPANPVEDLVMFKSRSSQLSPSPSKNAGAQAREQNVEPMRRGRPQPSPAALSAMPPASPSKDRDKDKQRGGQDFSFDVKFAPVDDHAWRGVRGHKSGMASIGGGNAVSLNSGDVDAWGIGSKSASRPSDSKQKSFAKQGFESDFSSSFTAGFGDSFDPPKRLAAPSASPRTQPIQISRPTPSPVSSDSSAKRRTQPRDAFEGLGLTPPPPPQTLADVRRTRASVSGTSFSISGTQSPSTGQILGLGLGSSSTTYRPPNTNTQSLSPMPQSLSPMPQSQSRPHSPAAQSSSFRPLPTRPVELSAEERFPSLEDLDRNFTSSSPGKRMPASIYHAVTQPPSTERLAEKSSTGPGRPPSRGSAAPASRSNNLLGAPGYGAGDQQLTRQGSLSSARFDGTRSQQVTGTAMRESRLGHGRHPTSSAGQSIESSDASRPPLLSRHTRPVQPRRHRSSLSVRSTTASSNFNSLGVPASSSFSPPTLPPRPSPQPEQRDWLTGASDDETFAQPSPQAVLRESPSKRASYIERSPMRLEKPLEAVSVEATYTRSPVAEPRREPDERTGVVGTEHVRNVVGERLRQERTQIQADLTNRRAAEKVKDDTPGERAKLDEQREGRRSPTKANRAFVTRNGTDVFGAVRTGLKLPGMEPQAKALPSSSGLTDNWSPISPPQREFSKETESSSGEEGPEDLGGYKPGSTGDKPAERVASDANDNRAQRSKRSGHKDRQNSVHDLADLWGGASQPPRSPSKMADKRRSAIVSSSSMKPSSIMDKMRSSSPQPQLDMTPAVSNPSTPSRLANRPPSRQQTRKATMSGGDGSARLNTTPSANVVASPAPVPASATPSRTRPQSMFLNPVSRSAPLEAHISSPGSAAQQSAQGSDPKQRRSGRRTSISDMVSRYEAINGNVKPVGGAPPPVAPKPPQLGKTFSESSSAGLPSPSSAAARFPNLSPPSSPVSVKASLTVPDTSEPVKEDLARHRRSPSPGVNAYASRMTQSAFKPSVNTTGNLRQPAPKPAPEVKKQADVVPSWSQEPTASAQPEREDSSTSEQARPPSPEKPYRGVSKLISQWQQRAVENNETVDQPRAAGAVPRRGVASGSIRGR